MNWEATGDFVSGIAVLVTLLYLLIQTRHSTEQLRRTPRPLAFPPSILCRRMAPVFVNSLSPTRMRRSCSSAGSETLG